MPLRDIFKRQIDNLLSTERNRTHVSLEEDLRNEFDRAVGNAIDPGRGEREAARREADIERSRTQAGLGQFVTIEGLPGEWEAVEMFHADETSVAFTLVDRRSGETAQLSAVDDGTVILDWPGGQHGAIVTGAYWRSSTQAGLRLAGAVLLSDGERPLTLSGDLRADLPSEEPDYSDGER